MAADLDVIVQELFNAGARANKLVDEGLHLPIRSSSVGLGVSHTSGAGSHRTHLYHTYNGTRAHPDHIRTGTAQARP